MQYQLLEEIKQLNPWLEDLKAPIIPNNDYIPRKQLDQTYGSRVGYFMDNLNRTSRRAGKTTLGKHLANKLIQKKRYSQLLYLNCDYLSIRQWLKSPTFIRDALKELNLKSPILFIDEVQRITNPGLILKAIIDLGLPIKLIATGSSQLAIKSEIQEFLTGRQFSSLILPLSHEEWSTEKNRLMKYYFMVATLKYYAHPKNKLN